MYIFPFLSVYEEANIFEDIITHVRLQIVK